MIRSVFCIHRNIHLRAGCITLIQKWKRVAKEKQGPGAVGRNERMKEKEIEDEKKGKRKSNDIRLKKRNEMKKKCKESKIKKKQMKKK